MTIATVPQTCISCERPLSLEDAAVPNMPVCKYCLQGHPQPGNRVAIIAPRSIVLCRLALILPGMVIGLVVGAVVSWLAFVPLSPASMTLLPASMAMNVLLLVAKKYIHILVASGLLGALLFTVLWTIILYSRIQHAGVDEWRSQLIKALNLEGPAQCADTRPSLVLCCWRRARLRDLTLPMQVGILFELPQGLAFCSAQGTRAVIPFSGVTAVRTERLKLLPPRMAVRLEVNTAEGLPSIKGQGAPKQILFAFMDEKSFKANGEKARAMQQHIQHILSASRM